MIMGIVFFVDAMCVVPVAYSIGKDVGYGDGYEDAMTENRDEHYLTD